MKTIRFGLIGCGLMGREFASAVSRWHHLQGLDGKPQLLAICDRFDLLGMAAADWFRENYPTIEQITSDYRDLVANPHLDAVYCAVPHNLHAEMYIEVIRAGKHLLGEKPFGIDLEANRRILEECRRQPGVVVRCSSEFPFFPAVQRIGAMVEEGAFGRILEVNTGFLHSSDLDPSKPINWKRMIAFNGEYGCMGDLGLHACHFPFRAGWVPLDVRAILSNIITQRPDGKGQMVPCETWDNAELLCRAKCEQTGDVFPWTIRTHRIAPGEKNTWYLEVMGTKASARFSTKNPKLLQLMDYRGGEQYWQHLDTGHETAFKSLTGGIFEFGFSDSILQMWASFIYEVVHGRPKSRFAGCVTPEETALSHRLFTAALESNKTGTTVPV